MAEQNTITDVFEKDIDWSSTIGVTMPVSDVEVYQRVENIETTLLENGALRIEALLKLFALISSDLEDKHVFNPEKVFSKNLEISTFVNLHPEISREDILSIDHQVIIKNYVTRPDKILINGTLKLKISFMVHLVLDGTVTDFLSKAPINKATVNVRDLESKKIINSATTDNNGRYYFNNLPPGVYLVVAITDNHKPEDKVSVIKARDTVNFVLHK